MEKSLLFPACASFLRPHPHTHPPPRPPIRPRRAFRLSLSTEPRCAGCWGWHWNQPRAPVLPRGITSDDRAVGVQKSSSRDFSSVSALQKILTGDAQCLGEAECLAYLQAALITGSWGPVVT